MQKGKNKNSIKFIISILFVVSFFAHETSAYTPMTSLTLIHPAASQPARFGVAYPGIEYNVRAAVIGGKFPYTYSLSGAPSGMNIDSQTGEISWINPQATANNVQITVVDSLGTSVNYTWTITVTTNGFKFVDVEHGNDTGGDGSLNNPWQTFGKVIATAASSDIVYFREGTYTPTWSGDGWLSSSRAGTWLGYPGENVTFNFGLNSGYRLGITRQFYFDNLTFFNGSQWMLYVASNINRYVVRRCIFNDLNLTSGSNPAFIRYEDDVVAGTYGVIQDNTFHDTENTTKGSVSMYTQDYPLIEDNHIYDSGHTQIDLKEGIRWFTVRRNYIDNNGYGKSGPGGPGELSDDGGTNNRCSGEWTFNYIKANDPNYEYSAGGLYICSDSTISNPQSLAFYRNTIYGLPYMSYCTDAKNVGPISFEHNVIINDNTSSDGDSADKIYNRQTTNFTNWSKTDNLLLGTADNGIDLSTGALQGGYASYTGTRGWEFGSDPSDTIPPANPNGLSVT